MKHLNHYLFVAVAALLATACEKEEPTDQQSTFEGHWTQQLNTKSPIDITFSGNTFIWHKDGAEKVKNIGTFSYKDSLLRSQAEFQNYKKRNASVRAEAYDDGVRETIFACLPAIDNLELALKHAESQGETGGVYEGVRMTLKQLTESLGKLGLTEIPALGEQFDPELHNAVMRESGGEENVISEVFQKGYRVKDKIIRYAMVKVFSGEE